jgi:hypothetical protein
MLARSTIERAAWLASALALGCDGAPRRAGQGSEHAVESPSDAETSHPSAAPAPASTGRAYEGHHATFVPEVTFESGYCTSFRFPPAISENELVAMLVEDFDSDGDCAPTRLVVQRAGSATVTKAFELVHPAPQTGATPPPETAALVSRDLEPINAWLAQKAWRPLTVCGGPEAPCNGSYEPPHYSLKAGSRVVRHLARDWGSRHNEARCWPINETLVGRAACDPNSGWVAVTVGWLGGHVGCPAPRPELRWLRLGPGVCPR